MSSITADKLVKMGFIQTSTAYGNEYIIQIDNDCDLSLFCEFGDILVNVKNGKDVVCLSSISVFIMQDVKDIYDTLRGN